MAPILNRPKQQSLGSWQAEVVELKRYLFQLVEQLEFILNNIERSKDRAPTQSIEQEVEQTIDTFNSIKGFILNSPEIRETYNKREMPSKTDFNNLTKETITYIIPQAPSALECLNFPIDVQGKLEVIRWSRYNKEIKQEEGKAFQTYVAYDDLSSNTYSRVISWVGSTTTVSPWV